MEHFLLVSVLANVALVAYAISVCRSEGRIADMFTEAVSRYRQTRRALREAQNELSEVTKDRDEWRELLNFTEQELEREQQAYDQLTVAYTMVLLNVNKRLDIAPETVATLN